MPIRVEPKIKKKKKKVTPLGRLKKQGPKPGSFSYQQEQTLKPGYKVPPMMIGGEIRPFKDKGLERKQRPMDRIQKRDRMKQRPKKTKTKWELDNFLKKCYIENIWVFRKGEERVPLFSRGLEDFFV